MKNTLSLIIHYDDQCRLCRRWIRLLQKYAALSGVEYVGLSEAPKDIQELSEKHNAWVIQRGEENYLGYAGFVECMKQSRFFWWYGYIGNIWPLRSLGNILYRTLSCRRKTCSLQKK